MCQAVIVTILQIHTHILNNNYKKSPIHNGCVEVVVVMAAAAAVVAFAAQTYASVDFLFGLASTEYARSWTHTHLFIHESQLPRTHTHTRNIELC